MQKKALFLLTLLFLAAFLVGCERGSLADSKNEPTAIVYKKNEVEEDFENGDSLKKYSRPKVVHLPTRREIPQ